MLIFESIFTLQDNSLGQVFCLVSIGRIVNPHKLLLILFFEFAQVSFRLVYKFIVLNSWIVAYRRHRKAITLSEIKHEWNCEVKGAIARVVIIVLVLIDCFH